MMPSVLWMANQLDEAFNWLVLILITTSGALSQFPEIFYFLPESPVGSAVAIVRIVNFPVIVLVLIWLWGYLTNKTEHQVALKSFSWIFAFIILLYLLVFHVLSFTRPGGPPENGDPQHPLSNFVAVFLILGSPLYLSPLLFHRVVRPKMREIYQDSKFLSSLSQEVLTYIAAVLLYFFATGAIGIWI